MLDISWIFKLVGEEIQLNFHEIGNNNSIYCFYHQIIKIHILQKQVSYCFSVTLTAQKAFRSCYFYFLTRVDMAQRRQVESLTPQKERSKEEHQWMRPSIDLHSEFVNSRTVIQASLQTKILKTYLKETRCYPLPFEDLESVLPSFTMALMQRDVTTNEQKYQRRTRYQFERISYHHSWVETPLSLLN